MGLIRIGFAIVALLAIAVVVTAFTLNSRNSETTDVADGLSDPRLAGLTHSVRYTDIVPFEAFLNAGEEPPERTLWPVYAEARAAVYAQEECQRLLDILAASCVVAESDASPARDDHFQIAIRLAFAPADDMGDLPDRADLSAETQIVELSDEVRTNVSPEDFGALRANYYRAALQACDSARANGSACLVDQIVIEQSDSFNEEGRYNVSGRALVLTD